MNIKYIKQKIETRAYLSASRAQAAVNRSGHSAKEKKELIALIPKYYDGQTTPDRLEPTVDIGKMVVRPPGDLEKEMMHISLKMLNIMIRYNMSREQAFDRLKETLMAGVG